MTNPIDCFIVICSNSDCRSKYWFFYSQVGSITCICGTVTHYDRNLDIAFPYSSPDPVNPIPEIQQDVSIRSLIQRSFERFCHE